MRIAALSGGVGGARFLRGLLQHLRVTSPDVDHEVTVVANTGDDITLHGLRVCPDLDTVMYTLGGAVHEEQGWGRRDETSTVAEELAAYGAGPDWFTLGDRDVATHLVRTQMLGAGYGLAAVTEALCRRWQPGVRLLPMTEQPVETHVLVEDPDRRAVHLQEWWVRMRAGVPAHGFPLLGLDRAVPAPGVLDALRHADVVLLPPSNPVVSLGPVLSVPGVRDVLRGTRAPVVGVSPVIGGTTVRGMAAQCLAALDVPCTAAGVAGLLEDVLDGWLVDHVDAPDGVAGPGGPGASGGPGRADRGATGARVVATDLLMRDVDGAARLAGTALDLALELAGTDVA
ncbi:2-phospho-L-lactate transferase [Aquipuribacter sp. MA13-6]|uniref:2-phospho-L-lactate transferase n=1 Tax=unclassified Aquipuribacter TaxID=2635084 RepID=UPI003EEB0909